MKSSSNSSEFKYIPPEVLTQILANLPSKTLLRFRCVCKSWCSIIDHPDFVWMHLQHYNSNNNNTYNSGKCLSIDDCSISNGCLMTLRIVNTLENICNVFRSFEKYHIKARCKSLVLLCRFQNFQYNEIRICNPSIRKSLLLPPCPLFPSGVYKTTFVFGFAPLIKDFKVIVISFKCTQSVRLPEMHVAVFTLSDQQWDVRNNGLKMDCSTFARVFKSYYSPSNACYSKGAAHWLGNDPYWDSSHQMGVKPTHLISLDFDTENFDFLELPIVLDETETRFVFLLGKSLAIFSISSVRSVIWVLKQESGKREWSQCFLGPSSVDSCNFFSQINSRVARLLYYEGDGGYLVYGNKSYNIATCQIRKLGKFVSPGVELELEMYSESLVLCKGYGAEYMESSSF